MDLGNGNRLGDGGPVIGLKRLEDSVWPGGWIPIIPLRRIMFGQPAPGRDEPLSYVILDRHSGRRAVPCAIQHRDSSTY